MGWIKVLEDSRNLIQFYGEQNAIWNLNNSKLKQLLSDLPFWSSLSRTPAVILSSQGSHLFYASLGNLKKYYPCIGSFDLVVWKFENEIVG